MKYRAWHKNNKKMYNVLSINLIQNYVICSGNLIFHLKDVELLKFTGFYSDYDDIYVGDIVKFGNHYYKVKEELNTPCLLRLNFDYIDYNDFEKSIYYFNADEPSFMGLKHDYIVSLYEIACNQTEIDECLECEVVGNIYENYEEFLKNET